MSTAYGAPAYIDLDYGDEVLNAHEVSQLAAKVQKYPPLPAGHSYYRHSTPKPLLHPVPHHHSTPAPPLPPPVKAHPPSLPPLNDLSHFVEPIPITDHDYYEYEDPIDYKVGFLPSLYYFRNLMNLKHFLRNLVGKV